MPLWSSLLCLASAASPPLLPEVVLHPGEGLSQTVYAGLGAIIDRTPPDSIPLDATELCDGKASLRIMASGFAVDGWRASLGGPKGATFDLEPYAADGVIDLAVKGLRGGEEVRLTLEDRPSMTGKGVVFGMPLVIPSKEWSLLAIPLKDLVRDPAAFRLRQTWRLSFSSRRDATFWVGLARVRSQKREAMPSPLRVNQWGWDPGAPKRVVLALPEGGKAPRGFRVMDERGRAVASGGFRPLADLDPASGESLWEGDLSGLRSGGTFFVQAEGLPASPSFVVGPNRSLELARKALRALTLMRKGSRWEGTRDQAALTVVRLLWAMDVGSSRMGEGLAAEARYGLEGILQEGGPWSRAERQALAMGAALLRSSSPDLAARCLAALDGGGQPEPEASLALGRAWSEPDWALLPWPAKPLPEARASFSRWRQSLKDSVWGGQDLGFPLASAPSSLLAPTGAMALSRRLGANAWADRLRLQKALDQALGVNPGGRSYVTGLGDASPSSPVWPFPFRAPEGLLVAGPAAVEGRFYSRFPGRAYRDVPTDPNVNGVAPEWNGLLVLAALLADRG